MIIPAQLFRMLVDTSPFQPTTSYWRTVEHQQPIDIQRKIQMRTGSQSIVGTMAKVLSPLLVAALSADASHAPCRYQCLLVEATRL